MSLSSHRKEKMRNLLLLLVATLLLVALTNAQGCQHDCSGHGTCIRGRCDCDPNYEADDCSRKVVPLSSGVVATDSVEKSDWVYYSFHNVNSQSSMVWWLNTTSESGDCDLYLQRGEIPSRISFTARNISTSPNQVIILSERPQGYYYAGVYGYQGCSFRLSVTVEAPCPSDCNGHGTCERGVCLCEFGYSGDSCETLTQFINPGESSEKTLEQGKWDYYAFTPEQVFEGLNWVMAMLTESDSEDCDIYLRKGDRPTMWEWDILNVTANQVIYINQTEVTVGETYYLGVYGFKGGDYSLRLEGKIPSGPGDCPNRCSNHGASCQMNICTCLDGYTGDQCDFYNPSIAYEAPVTGYAGENAWNYYHFPGDVSEDVLVTLSYESGDCDLYVNANEKPTRFNYQYANMSTRAEISVTIIDPQGSEWYVGIFGWSACEYSLTVTTTTSCPCSEHGHCDEGNTLECICDEGWGGDDCSIPIQHIESTVPVTGKSVRSGEWQYYHLVVEESSAVSFTVTEKSTQGATWLFVSHSEYPTLSVNDFQEKGNGKVHQITYITQEAQSREVFIGVFGSPIAVPYVGEEEMNQGADYQLSVWAASF